MLYNGVLCFCFLRIRVSRERIFDKISHLRDCQTTVLRTPRDRYTKRSSVKFLYFVFLRQNRRYHDVGHCGGAPDSWLRWPAKWTHFSITPVVRNGGGGGGGRGRGEGGNWQIFFDPEKTIRDQSFSPRSTSVLVVIYWRFALLLLIVSVNLTWVFNERKKI